MRKLVLQMSPLISSPERWNEFIVRMAWMTESKLVSAIIPNVASENAEDAAPACEEHRNYSSVSSTLSVAQMKHWGISNVSAFSLVNDCGESAESVTSLIIVGGVSVSEETANTFPPWLQSAMRNRPRSERMKIGVIWRPDLLRLFADQVLQSYGAWILH